MFMKKIYAFLLIASSLAAIQGQTPQNALHFDKINDFATAANASGLLVGKNTYSMTAWVYPTTPNPSFPNFDGIVGIRNESNCDFYILQLSGTTYEARFRNSSGTPFTIASPTVTLNQWQHLALVYDGSTLKFYKNGVLSGSVAASGSFSNATQSFHLGRLPLNATTSFYFGGKLDDPALWGKALTASEVLCLYKGDLAPTTTGLLLHYSFNTGVANGSNATLTTLPATVGTIPAVTSNMAMTGTASNLVNGTGSFGLLNATVCKGSSYMVGTTAYTQAGTYLAKTTGAEGCDSLFDLVLTLDSAAGTVTTTTACANAPTGTATAIGTAGGAPFTYSWATNPVQNTATAVGLSGGTYPVTITAANGCSTTVNAQVPVHPAINASVQPAWNVLTALPAGADGYQWWNCGTSSTLPGQISTTFTPTTNGSYAVIVALNGCTDTSACVPVGNVSLDEGEPTALVIYPQPATTELLWQFTDAQALSVRTVVLRDLRGAAVAEQRAQSGENRLNVRGLPAGLYVLQCGTAAYRVAVE
jgi:hypothetical protein